MFFKVAAVRLRNNCPISQEHQTVALMTIAPALASVGDDFVAFCTTLDKAGRLAHAIAEIIQLGASDAGVPFDGDFRNFGRMEGKRSFNPFASDDPANREHLAGSASAAGDHHAGKNLNSLFVAFQNPRVNVDGVADVEFQGILAKAGLFDLLQQPVHDAFHPQGDRSPAHRS
jgi:hypothetical protein